jgi:hypothetical protein
MTLEYTITKEQCGNERWKTIVDADREGCWGLINYAFRTLFNLKRDYMVTEYDIEDNYIAAKIVQSEALKAILTLAKKGYNKFNLARAINYVERLKNSEELTIHCLKPAGFFDYQDVIEIYTVRRECECGIRYVLIGAETEIDSMTVNQDEEQEFMNWFKSFIKPELQAGKVVFAEGDIPKEQLDSIYNDNHFTGREAEKER